jgi:hypothetical protein
VRTWLAWPCATLLACGSGAIESPESLARAVFETVRTRNLDAFLSYQLQMKDLEAQCPALDATSRAEAQTELALARDEAARSFDACLRVVRLEGARFVRADRSPDAILNFRWPSCQSTLSFEFLRLTFDVGGTAGTLLITKVAFIGGRWVFQDGVRLCEGPPP